MAGSKVRKREKRREPSAETEGSLKKIIPAVTCSGWEN